MRPIANNRSDGAQSQEDELLPPYNDEQLRDISTQLQQAARHEVPQDECVDGLWQPWTGLVEDEAIRYRIMCGKNDTFDDDDTTRIRDELKQFRRRLERVRTALSEDVAGLQSLGKDARAILGFGALRPKANIEEVSKQLMDCQNAVDQLLVSANAGMELLQQVRSEDAILYQFVLGLACIYEPATGRNIGRAQHFQDKTYQGPSEAFLMACLTPVRRKTKIGSVRGLIRKIQKQRR